MKLVFIDEFKFITKVGGVRADCYGLVANVIDSVFYGKFKYNFNSAFKKLGWNACEIKGRFVYSKKGEKDISIEDRINFAKDLFALSTSKTKKNSIIHTYVTFGLFNCPLIESEKYNRLLKNIAAKIDQPSTLKGDKGLIAFFLDNNECLERGRTMQIIEENLKERNHLFERPFFVDSCNLNPGIIITDFVCYFHENILQLQDFTEATKDVFVSLIDKYKNESISQDEMVQLKGFLDNQRKLKTSGELLEILKKITYVKYTEK